MQDTDQGTNPTYVDCTFRNNTAPAFWGGAAVAQNGATPTYQRCRFEGNSSDRGGAIYAFRNPPFSDTMLTLKNCLFDANSAVSNGGAISATDAVVTAVNCLFVNHEIFGVGGAIAGYAGTTVALTNSTLAANTALFGGATYMDASSGSMTNTIMHGNTSSGGGGMDGVELSASFSIVQDFGIDDPLLDANFRLQGGSPAIDAGDNTAPALVGIVTDLAGYLRYIDDLSAADVGNGAPPIVDIGAYEFFPDCNHNSVIDSDDISVGTSVDCDNNQYPDECGVAPDCNSNGSPDQCDITATTSVDCNTNGTPDECELQFAETLEIGNPAPLNTDASGPGNSYDRPQIATDSAGHWIAVWQCYDGLGGTLGADYDILFARSTNDGTTWSAPAPLNPSAAADNVHDRYPQVVADGAGNWIASWSTEESAGNFTDIFFTRSMDEGATWSAPARLNGSASPGSSWDRVPQLATDSAGLWIAVWESTDSLGGTIETDYDIHYARSTDNGATWTAAAALNNNAGFDSVQDHEPQLATDGLGNWIVVWWISPNTTDEDIYFARSSDDGVSWSDPVTLNTTAASDSGIVDKSPELTTDGAGTWIAVWQSENDLSGTIGSDMDILWARSTDNGATWTAPQPLNSNASVDSGGDFLPQVTADAAGNWIAAWHSNDNLSGTIGYDFDVFVARSTNNGASWSAPMPIRTISSDSIQPADVLPQLTTDHKGLWNLVWRSDADFGGAIGHDDDILIARFELPSRVVDCDTNGILDECEHLADCDSDGIVDVCEVALPVEIITLRSGNGSPGAQDSLIHFLDGPVDAPFCCVFGSFNEVKTGPKPYIISSPNTAGWISSIPADPLAEWIKPYSPDGNAPEPTAMYGIPFYVGTAMRDQVTIEFKFAVDNVLGTGPNQGLYINAFPVPGGFSGGGFGSQTAIVEDVTSLISTGTNWLYMNVTDLGGSSGIIFSATITVMPAPPFADCNSNGVPDECDADSDSNGIPDECDIPSGTSPDCNTNGIDDSVDIAAGTSTDCNTNQIPDDCELAGNDCNFNGTLDDCEVAGDDCDDNGELDSCEIAADPGQDINTNGILDACEQPVCLIISEIMDGTLTGGSPKYVEITNTGLTDFTFAEGGLIIQSNLSNDLTIDVDLTGVTVAAGDSFVMVSDNQDGDAAFVSVFGFAADLVSPFGFGNGNDRYILTSTADTSVILDSYGEDGVDGTGTVWEYTDSYAYRLPAFAAGKGLAFVPAEWDIAPVGTLTGVGEAGIAAAGAPGAHAVSATCETCGNVLGVALDLDDFDLMEPCLLGPTGGIGAPVCDCFDFDGSGTVDLLDFADVQIEIASN